MDANAIPAAQVSAGPQGTLVTSYRPYRPNPEAEAAYAGYLSTVEDLLGIQELFDDARAVQAKVARARVIEETDTRNERIALVCA